MDTKLKAICCPLIPLRNKSIAKLCHICFHRSEESLSRNAGRLDKFQGKSLVEVGINKKTEIVRKLWRELHGADMGLTDLAQHKAIVVDPFGQPGVMFLQCQQHVPHRL